MFVGFFLQSNAQSGGELLNYVVKDYVLHMNKSDLIDRIFEFTVDGGHKSWNDFKAGYTLANGVKLSIPNSIITDGFKALSEGERLKIVKVNYDNRSQSVSLMDARVIGIMERGGSTILSLKYKAAR